MKQYNLESLSEKKLAALFSRPAISTENIIKKVKPIIAGVKKNGDKAVLNYSRKFDGFTDESTRVSAEEINNSGKLISKELKNAIEISIRNISKFHKKQFPKKYSLETVKGVRCERRFLPIENVGLYIPGGSAVLVSTVLMLAIPAKIAGCKRIVLTTPAKNGIINPAVLYAAKRCGVNEIYKIGGAQAIAMLAYGTESVNKVDKIFGPGNQYVTAAKTLISIDPLGCSIDMPAGPSEVLIIGDKYSNPAFVAADLLSQAEHGTDSQVIFISTDIKTVEAVNREVDAQLKLLPRRKIADVSLKSSFILLVGSLEKAVELSNKYAPEHLILNLKNADSIADIITNAGSVFIGQYSPESAGDYSSGTNHSLPTYGYARSHSGVSVESFMKSITFQKLNLEGLKKISKAVITLAETEKLEAHSNAVKIRLIK